MSGRGLCAPACRVGDDAPNTRTSASHRRTTMVREIQAQRARMRMHIERRPPMANERVVFRRSGAAGLFAVAPLSGRGRSPQRLLGAVDRGYTSPTRRRVRAAGEGESDQRSEAGARPSTRSTQALRALPRRVTRRVLERDTIHRTRSRIPWNRCLHPTRSAFDAHRCRRLRPRATCFPRTCPDRHTPSLWSVCREVRPSAARALRTRGTIR